MQRTFFFFKKKRETPFKEKQRSHPLWLVGVMEKTSIMQRARLKLKNAVKHVKIYLETNLSIKRK